MRFTRSIFAAVSRKLSQSFLRTVLFLGMCSSCLSAAPVEFTFQLPTDKGQNPFARELWAEVIMPSGKNLRLPVFYAGGENFAVRARASEVGDYHLGKITEKIGKKEIMPAAKIVTPTPVRVEAAGKLPQVTRAAGDHSRLIFEGSDRTYTPIGANLAWASEGRAAFYERALPQFGAEGLNWTRIWMAHWDGLNLDWLPVDMGASPPAGQLDLRVAAEWDRIVASAENSGVYFQMVLQHHGQVSTLVNPNWPLNPWNAANPRGFLSRPKNFFTSPVAIKATLSKYRYIVARWGYSPAVLAWELFNEVHWVDAIRVAHDEPAVARWHDRMADYLRSVDVYGHLVTTSTEDLGSAIYRKMDYFQPHLYPYSILVGPLNFNVPQEKLDRPIFYGETGDDHAPLNDAQKDSGIAIVPPVWTSLMGRSRYPVQPWLGEKILQSNRLSELGAVARFLAGTGLETQAGLVPFAPRVECEQQVPFVLEASQVWQKRGAPEFELPLDGRMPVQLADVPRVYVGSPKSLAEGLPGRATYHVNFPKETTLRARITGVGAGGSAIRISCGGKVVAEKSWKARASDKPSWDRPTEIIFHAPAGPQALVVENPGAADWFQLDAIETDIPVPVLAAMGRRADSFMAVWLWHRQGVFALAEPAPAGGTLVLDDVPQGKWTITWWDTLKGTSGASIEVLHQGGPLRVSVPAFARHAAVVLIR